MYVLLIDQVESPPTTNKRLYASATASRRLAHYELLVLLLGIRFTAEADFAVFALTGVLVTAADAFVLLLVEQWGVRQLEAVFGLFIAVMAGSFGIMYSNADIPQNEVVKG